MNELHGYPWYRAEYATAWFQIHPKISFTREHKHDHWEWLQQEHPFPIYMQMVYDNVPSSKKYPLQEIQKELVNVERGESSIKSLFSSSFNYQMALALYLGYERIEIYGVSMTGGEDYAHQREAMAYWIGKADGMGAEVWLPEQCSLLVQPLYAYEGSTGMKEN